MLEQLPQADREAIYRWLAEMLWAELQEPHPEPQEAPEPRVREVEPAAE